MVNPGQTPLATKHLLFLLFSRHNIARLIVKQDRTLPSSVKQTKMQESPQETIIWDGEEHLWILNDHFHDCSLHSFLTKSKNKNLMFSSNTKDHRWKLCCCNPIWESNLIFQRAHWIFALLIHSTYFAIICYYLGITMKPINITGMVIMCRGKCINKQQDLFLLYQHICFIYQGLRKKKAL